MKTLAVAQSLKTFKVIIRYGYKVMKGKACLPAIGAIVVMQLSRREEEGEGWWSGVGSSWLERGHEEEEEEEEGNEEASSRNTLSPSL